MNKIINEIKSNPKLIILVIIILSAIIIGPLATILAVNVLFNMGIPYSFINWLASLWLSFLIFPSK